MLPLIRFADPVPDSGALRERVVLVTGATGGLGRASALACARAGATVVLAGRKVRALEGLYDELVALEVPEPAIYPINLEGAAPDDYAGLAESVRLQCGRLDGIIHAAVHFNGLMPLDQVKPDGWLRTLQVGLTAPYALTQACLPLMRASSDAAIVFVLDDMDRVSKAYWGGYGVAKSGLAALASIAHEETESGPVRVHGLLPAPMRTALRRMAYFGENTLEREPPDASGSAAAYLLSPAATALRGHTLDLRPLNDGISS
ncbi:SDR family NAD(P)-dependent oxidoreductase [Dokdonella sp.]|uniref:SDR family NAD(P)-dependent oxidoreductase n=1 Tax=Dokdonella sp. TaxID=2291710 RepID=UPI003528544D